jgi:transposase
VALAATTGWRFVVKELQRVGATVHRAEPAETAARRGNEKRAKNDSADARHLRELVMVGRLPESWIPAAHILDLRARLRLRLSLVVSAASGSSASRRCSITTGSLRRNLMTDGGRQWLAGQTLPARARDEIAVAGAMIGALDQQLAPIDKQLRSSARRQPGCRALMGQFGVGEMTAVTIVAELGDARRFSSSRDAVRSAGLDITVHQSDRRRKPGHLSRQGPPALRWALFEAALCASRSASPDRDYYRQTACASAAPAPASRSRASCSSAAGTRCASSARRR